MNPVTPSPKSSGPSTATAVVPELTPRSVAKLTRTVPRNPKYMNMAVGAASAAPKPLTSNMMNGPSKNVSVSRCSVCEVKVTAEGERDALHPQDGGRRTTAISLEFGATRPASPQAPMTFVRNSGAPTFVTLPHHHIWGVYSSGDQGFEQEISKCSSVSSFIHEVNKKGGVIHSLITH
mmetsp:Transcript_8272/g.22951  ORF Transcript_8272/g.22951 Transcript_8272/m.22951 type:complete len:178 (+) Transcript_8272:3325-3858(+)